MDTLLPSCVEETPPVANRAATQIALRTVEAPAWVLAAVAEAQMDPRHKDLDALLD